MSICCDFIDNLLIVLFFILDLQGLLLKVMADFFTLDIERLHNLRSVKSLLLIEGLLIVLLFILGFQGPLLKTMANLFTLDIERLPSPGASIISSSSKDSAPSCSLSQTFNSFLVRGATSSNM